MIRPGADFGTVAVCFAVLPGQPEGLAHLRADEFAGCWRSSDESPKASPGERPLLGAPRNFHVLLTAQDEGRVYLVFDHVKAGEAPAKTQAYKIAVLADASVTDDIPEDGSPRSMSRDLFQDPDDLEDAGGNAN